MSYPQLNGLRLLLADDHAIVRFGFRLLLESVGAEIVGEAANGETVLELYQTATLLNTNNAGREPNALVMDVSMPGIGGFGALERLLARYPKAKVLMLSAHEDQQIPARALKQGALGYLRKGAEPGELIKAIATVAQGQRYLDASLAPQLALASLGMSNDPVDCLSEREFAVFLQLAQGKSVQDIATSHHLSPSTVGTHLYHIKQKLNLTNQAELALLAVRSGLVEV